MGVCPVLKQGILILIVLLLLYYRQTYEYINFFLFLYFQLQYRMTQSHSHPSDDLGYTSGDRRLYSERDLSRSYPSYLSTSFAYSSDVHRGLYDYDGRVSHDTVTDSFTSSGVRPHSAVAESFKRTEYSQRLPLVDTDEAELNHIGKPGVVGITNHGNTCFASSVIQCLSNTEHFTEHFVNDHHRARLVAAKQAGRECVVTDGLARLIESLWTQAYTLEFSRDLMRTVRENTELFAESNEHDAEEFLLWLLNTVNDELYGSSKQDAAKQVILCIYALKTRFTRIVSIHIPRVPLNLY